MKLRSALLLMAMLALPLTMARAEETRQLVQMPPMMRAHMLATMRSHLQTLNAILAALAEGRLEAAGDIAERRLGMSSLSLHGAEHMAPYMPPGMRTIGTRMHRSASRFAIVLQRAQFLPAEEGALEIFQALQAITENCVACHDAYRLH